MVKIFIKFNCYSLFVSTHTDPQSEGVQNGKSIRKEATEQTEIEKYWSIVEAVCLKWIIKALCKKTHG